MRYILCAAIAGFFALAGGPAHAQQGYTPTQQPQAYAVPMYLAPSGPTMYSTLNNGSAPLYNNMGQPLPMEQMIAGKNAPSYTINNPRTHTGYGNMTEQQKAYQIMQQDRVNEAARQDYLASLRASMTNNAANNGAQGNSSVYQGSAFNSLYNNNQQVQQRPTKRKVVYNERNNPLVEPPRLFKID